jgi:hypothetical protein
MMMVSYSTTGENHGAHLLSKWVRNASGPYVYKEMTGEQAESGALPFHA